MPTAPVGTFLEAAFAGLLVSAAVMDVRARRVPNMLSGALLAGGLIAGALHLFGVTLGSAALGALIGLAIWIPFWMLGLLGAGDVKFFAAACAWLGPSVAWRASLGVALIGGLMGAVMLVRRRGVKEATEFGIFGLTNPRDVVRNASHHIVPASARSFPYAVPMALVTGGAMFFPRFFR